LQQNKTTSESLTSCFAERDGLNKKFQEATTIISSGNNCNQRINSVNDQLNAANKKIQTLNEANNSLSIRVSSLNGLQSELDSCKTSNADLRQQNSILKEM